MDTLKYCSISLIVLLMGFMSAGEKVLYADQLEGITGSTSCRSCHEKFYQLWSTSYHGLAMQPYTA
ncbi:MAG: hypothetical protein KAS98_14915, partial [Deltaproteobacteria bacterium]|nr:hypothetical protein [Deltaproteobacteria bacterium]